MNLLPKKVRVILANHDGLWEALELALDARTGTIEGDGPVFLYAITVDDSVSVGRILNAVWAVSDAVSKYIRIQQQNQIPGALVCISTFNAPTPILAARELPEVEDPALSTFATRGNTPMYDSAIVWLAYLIGEKLRFGRGGGAFTLVSDGVDHRSKCSAGDVSVLVALASEYGITTTGVGIGNAATFRRHFGEMGITVIYTPAEFSGLGTALTSAGDQAAICARRVGAQRR
jgi:hypothetical protein